jgi:autotransporter-associated beta strand protein
MKNASRTVPAPLRHSIAALLVFAAAAHTKAATYTWDGDPLTAGAQDGGGVWNPTNTNWISAGSNTIWNNANDAVFGASVDGSYAVSVALNPTAVSLAFNNSGYTLSATGAQTITVTNSSNTTNGAINLVAGKTATIGSGVTVTTAILNQNSAIAGAGTLIIENGGTVKNGGTANTNVLNINSTTVEVRTGGSLLTAPVAAGNGNAIFVNGNLNVVGGTVSAVGTLGIGQSAAAGTTAGTLTITNGTVAATSTNGVRFGAASGTTPGGTLNLNGGTLTAAIIFKGAVGTTNAVVNLNGGTLQASAASATFFQGLTRANVRNGGAIIDTNGRNITIGQALEHSNIAGDNATDGGLIKRGAGTLILNGANTYNGGTTVNTGTLQFNAGAFPLGLVTINSAGVLNATGAHAPCRSGSASATSPPVPPARSLWSAIARMTSILPVTPI